MSPVFQQRAAFISILSFLFFLAMMFGFYVRQSIGYFLLATAFLLVYLFTMTSWVLQRKNEVRIFENGFSFKKGTVRWSDVKAVGTDGVLEISDGRKLTIPRSIGDFDAVLTLIRSKASHQK